MTEAIFINKLDDANDFFRKNRSLLVLSSLLLFGMLIGAWSIKLCNNDNYYGVVDIFDNFLNKRVGQPFFISFLYSVLSSLPVLICSYVFGLCIIGSPAAVIIPFVYGFSMGISAGYLYSVYELKGIGFFALIMLPRLFINSITVIFASRETLRYSLKLFKVILPNSKPHQFSESFKLYSIKFIFFLIIIMFASLIDAIMSVAFIDFFKF